MQRRHVALSGKGNSGGDLFLALLLVVSATLVPTSVAERKGGACQIRDNLSDAGARAAGCSTSGSHAGIALLSVQWSRTRAANAPTPQPAPAVLAVANGSASAAPGESSQASPAAAGSAPASVAAGLPPSKQLAPSFSLASDYADAGGGMTGTVVRAPGGPSSEDADVNASAPLTQEHFEPFGYPGAGLLLELHMPAVTLRDLHTSSRNSLAQFLLEIRGAISQASNVDESRISILGIHGRYRRTDQDRFLHIPSSRVGHVSAPYNTVTDEEVIVRFEILPGWPNDSDPRIAKKDLEDQLRNPQSSLMQGNLADTLKHATVDLSTPVRGLPRAAEHRGMAHMSALAWPIGISAAFIGVLIWLAAY